MRTSQPRAPWRLRGERSQKSNWRESPVPCTQWNSRLFADQASHRSPQDQVRAHPRGPPKPDSADIYPSKGTPLQGLGYFSSLIQIPHCPGMTIRYQNSPVSYGKAIISTQTWSLRQALGLLQLGKEKVLIYPLTSWTELFQQPTMDTTFPAMQNPKLHLLYSLLCPKTSFSLHLELPATYTWDSATENS